MGYIQWHGQRAEDTWVSCETCGGAGADYSRDNEPTDRAHLHGTTPLAAFEGYYATNLCPQCQGNGGCWQPPIRPFRNARRWPTEGDKNTNSRVISLGQCWNVERGCWNPPLTEEMRAGFVCEYADDVTPPTEGVK